MSNEHNDSENVRRLFSNQADDGADPNDSPQSVESDYSAETDLNFDDVVDTYTEPGDLEAVMARARARFDDDVASAPVFMSARRRKRWQWAGGGVAAAAVAATVFALVSPLGGDNTAIVDVANTPSPTRATSTEGTTTDAEQTSSPAPSDTSTSSETSMASETLGEENTTPKSTVTSETTNDPGEESTAVTDWSTKSGRVGFSTQDGQVHCVWEAPWMQCAVVSPKFSTTKKPSWCDFDWGPEIIAGPRRKPSFMCVSDVSSTISSSNRKVSSPAQIKLPQNTLCMVSARSISCSFKGSNSFAISATAVTGLHTPSQDPDSGDADQEGSPKVKRPADPGDTPGAAPGAPEDEDSNSPTKDAESKNGNYKALTTNGRFLTSDKSIACAIVSSGAVKCAARKVAYDVSKKPARCGAKAYGAWISTAPARSARLECGSTFKYSTAGRVIPAGTTITGPKELACSVTSSSVTCQYGNGKHPFTYSSTYATYP